MSPAGEPVGSWRAVASGCESVDSWLVAAPCASGVVGRPEVESLVVSSSAVGRAAVAAADRIGNLRGDLPLLLVFLVPVGMTIVELSKY